MQETALCSCELSSHAPGLCLWHNSELWPVVSKSAAAVVLLAIFCLESSKLKGAMCRRLLEEWESVQKPSTGALPVPG